MSQMLVVHLARRYYPQIGGVEEHVGQVALKLQERGYCSTVLTLQHDAKDKLAETVKGVQIIRLKAGENGEQAAGFFGKLAYKIRIWKQVALHLSLLMSADIIQVHDVFWWLYPFLPFLSRSKTFITFHGYEDAQGPSAAQRRAHQLANWLAAGSLCVGNFHKKFYGVQATAVTYGAVDQNVLKKSIKRTHKSHKKEIKLVYIGRVAADNGILELLAGLRSASAVASHTNLKYTLTVMGEGPLLRQAKEYTHKYQLSVTFLGWVPGAAAHLGEYDIACVSRYLSILSALATDTPVFSFANTPLTREYLQSAPFANWITLYDSPKSCATQLASVKVAPAEARVWAQAQTWDTMADTYLSVWQKTHHN